MMFNYTMNNNKIALFNYTIGSPESIPFGTTKVVDLSEDPIRDFCRSVERLMRIFNAVDFEIYLNFNKISGSTFDFSKEFIKRLTESMTKAKDTIKEDFLDRTGSLKCGEAGFSKEIEELIVRDVRRCSETLLYRAIQMGLRIDVTLIIASSNKNGIKAFSEPMNDVLGFKC